MDAPPRGLLRRASAERRARAQAARLAALVPVLGPKLARATRRACLRLGRERALSDDQRRTLERYLARWMQARLQGGEGAAVPDPRILLELELSPRDAFVLLSELRTQLVGALLVARPASAHASRTAKDVEAIDRCFDAALLDLLQRSAGDLRRRLGREERLVMLGQLVASLIHELRNPLSVIDTSLLLLERRVERGQSVDLHIARARAQVDRSRKMIDDLLDMLRERPIQRRRVALKDIIEASLEALGSERTRVEVEIASGLPEVEVDPSQIQQVILNLLTNAFEASGPDAQVRIDAESTSGGVVVQVHDEGPGIPSEILPTLFEPLVSTKPGGVGMGLAVSRRLAEQNLGRLEAGNARDEGGAVFRLVLPEPARPTEPPLPMTEPLT